MAEGDLVAVYTVRLGSKPTNGGLRQVHLFRFSGDKVVEYWDITQVVPENEPNVAEAFTESKDKITIKLCSRTVL